MIKVHLKFPTGNDMYVFRQRATPKNIIMDLTNNSMICLCTKEEIDLAIKEFGAIVFNKEESPKNI